jgi:hypothetical protein
LLYHSTKLSLATLKTVMHPNEIPVVAPTGVLTAANVESKFRFSNLWHFTNILEMLFWP